MSEKDLEKEQKLDDEKVESTVDDSTKTDESKATEDTQEDSQVSDQSETSAEEPQIDYEDKFLRAQAEIQNIQQRFAKEQTQWRQYDGSRLATSILPVIDNLERALQVEADDEAAKQIKSGVEMTYKSMMAALAENNVSAFGEAGEDFDPEIHQAISKVPITDKSQKADTIAQVMQKGYKISDRTLRTAMVAVYTD